MLMEREQTFKCHKICTGRAEGKTLVSEDDICFYLADPKSGKIIEKNHALKGKSVAGTILIFPSGKGSSVVQGDGLYMLKKYETAPRAMIIQHPDTVLVTGAIIMKIPLVDGVEKRFYDEVEDGDFVRVDADQGLITLIKRED
jgi:predicted aconitase with swiveling domain